MCGCTAGELLGHSVPATLQPLALRMSWRATMWFSFSGVIVTHLALANVSIETGLLQLSCSACVVDAYIMSLDFSVLSQCLQAKLCCLCCPVKQLKWTANCIARSSSNKQPLQTFLQSFCCSSVSLESSSVSQLAGGLLSRVSCLSCLCRTVEWLSTCMACVALEHVFAIAACQHCLSMCVASIKSPSAFHAMQQPDSKHMR